ncbi:MAG: LysE family transporter [Terracidiphilus sp.]
MAIVSYIHVLAGAFLMGLAAAAPIGPVNMMAIRRGVAGGWRHTLACGAGAAFSDLALFSLALLGGRYLLPDLASPRLRGLLAAIGAVLLAPAGIYFLLLTFRDPLRAFHSARQRWGSGPVPAHLAVEALQAAAITLLNPFTMVYWAGVTSSWLLLARPVLGASAPGWGTLITGSGLMTWFGGLILLVRFIPRHISALFFRLANGVLSLILLGFAALCVLALAGHPPRGFAWPRIRCVSGRRPPPPERAICPFSGSPPVHWSVQRHANQIPYRHSWRDRNGRPALHPIA